MTDHSVEGGIVQILEQLPASPYNALPPELFAHLKDNEIAEANTSEICSFVLSYYLQSVQERLRKKKLPDSVRVLFDKELKRIEAGLEVETSAYFSFANDLFLKDLGLARLNLIPVGAELVDVHGGIPRSLLLKDGVRQFIRAGRFFLLETKGFKPFYQLHLDPRNLEEFSPQGWHKTYLRLAELLSLNPQYKGFFGASWFYDPALDHISSNLSYLRNVREAAGAELFKWGAEDDVKEMALKKSTARRDLYAKGQYKPCSYFLVWGRKELILWATKGEKDSKAEQVERKTI